MDRLTLVLQNCWYFLHVLFPVMSLRLVLEWLSAPSSRCSLRNGVRLGRAGQAPRDGGVGRPYFGHLGVQLKASQMHFLRRGEEPMMLMMLGSACFKAAPQESTLRAPVPNAAAFLRLRFGLMP